MSSVRRGTPEQRRFEGAAVVFVALTALFALLLLPAFPLSFRGGVSSAGLLVAGVFSTVSGFLRARRTPESAERRPWMLLASAGVIVILGNLWVAATGADPVTSPSLVSDLSIAVGLIVSTVGVLSFPSARRRGAELVVMVLDGIVAGGALLIIVSVLVYSQLLDSSATHGAVLGFLNLAFPVLDVVLATVSILLVLRAPRSQRLTLGLVTTGFLLYAFADLSFAARTAQGTFAFGSLLDLGWIVGYLALGLGSWVPLHGYRRQGSEPGPGLSDATGSMLVFALLLVAAVVQIGFGTNADPQGAQAVAWIVLILAAGSRQILLTGDNAALRRGLERRVSDQTADLRRLVRQNELLLESVGDGIYGVDRDGRITFVNPSAAASLGFTPADLLGRRAHDVLHVPDGEGTTVPWLGSYIQRAISGGVVAASEDDVYARSDGVTFPVEITAAPLLDDAEVRGAVVVFRDVTQRREIDRVKNEFLSVVSHELRTPLTSIRASLGLIEDGDLGELPPPARRMISVALDSSERLTRLINDLLDIERIESGTQPLQVQPVEARRLLDAVCHQMDGLARTQGVRIEVDPTVGRVSGDEDQIMQTLTNLVGNAIKFSDAGKVVRLEAREEGHMIRFQVRDEGRGIPADRLESVFERFVQVDSSDTRQKGGTGLGLAICKGIVERHGGRIWAESELGVGTTISFDLPSTIDDKHGLDMSTDGGEEARDAAGH